MSTNFTAITIIQAQLRPNEKLLWSGQPRPGIILRPVDALMIPFSLLWGGFAFWEYSVIASAGPTFFALWGIPFVMVGLYIIFGRFFVDSRRQTQMYYGVTQERIIIVSGSRSRKVNSLNIHMLSDLSMKEQSDGSGTITFGASLPMAAWSSGMAFPGADRYLPPSFEMIPDVKSVYALIEDAQAQASMPKD